MSLDHALELMRKIKPPPRSSSVPKRYDLPWPDPEQLLGGDEL